MKGVVSRDSRSNHPMFLTLLVPRVNGFDAAENVYV
jgi:hypothetical protein